MRCALRDVGSARESRAKLPGDSTQFTETRMDGLAARQESVQMDAWLPLVSVVIPTHGRPDLVRRTIASVVHQDYAGVIECIVVHDKEDVDLSLESDDP